jgi:putative endonuclease
MTRHLRNRANYFAGEAAELSVARGYEGRGYSIAARRWRGPGGEVDLITRNEEGLVFVEVKKSKTHAGAAERITVRQMERIYASAAQYLENEPMGQLTNVRFDVALVDASGRHEIIENAYGLG